MVGLGTDVGDDFGIGRVWNRRLEDADYCCGAGAEPDRFANHRTIAVERRRPETMCQHRNAGSMRTIVAGVDQASEDRAEAHDLEVRPADDAGLHDPWFAKTDQRELDDREVAKSGDGPALRFEIGDLGYGESGVGRPKTWCALTNVDELVLVAIDERAQQHTTDDAEDRGVGP